MQSVESVIIFEEGTNYIEFYSTGHRRLDSDSTCVLYVQCTCSKQYLSAVVSVLCVNYAIGAESMVS